MPNVFLIQIFVIKMMIIITLMMELVENVSLLQLYVLQVSLATELGMLAFLTLMIVKGILLMMVQENFAFQLQEIA